MIILLIIYAAFISLGLPDSILGVSVPAILAEWQLPLGAGGAVSTTIIGSTIISSFISGHFIEKGGTGRITAVSCLLTGGALLGFSLSQSFFWLIILAVPLGLGGGAVDAALNNYVALNYKARHMNWLHSFWGVGATSGPLIMSFFLNHGGSWRSGYRSISFIQLTLAVILLLSLPLWKRAGVKGRVETNENESLPDEAGLKRIFTLRGVVPALLTMMLYCTIEAAIGLWGSSYLIFSRGFTADAAAAGIALYYGGITAGRFLSGFFSIKLSNTAMIRSGIIAVLAGIIILLLPVNDLVTGIVIVFIGVGLAPVFPSMLHEIPGRFGKKNSQVLTGYHMGFGYIGSAFLSPGLGVLMQFTSVGLFPFILSIMALLLLTASERTIAVTKSIAISLH